MRTVVANKTDKNNRNQDLRMTSCNFYQALSALDKKCQKMNESEMNEFAKNSNHRFVKELVYRGYTFSFSN